MSSILFRFLVVLIGVVVPAVAQAQFSAQYEVGSYVLRNQQIECKYGQLKLRNGRKLLVKTAAGRKYRIKAKNALNCTIGQRYFSVISGLRFDINSNLVTEQAVFAQTLESGKVTLLRYDHLLNSGINWLFLYRYPIDVYLLRAQPDSTFVAAWDTFDKSYFRKQVRRFLIARVDLVKLLDDGFITYQNFPNAIRALNHNLPFQPLAVPERKE